MKCCFSVDGTSWNGSSDDTCVLSRVFSYDTVAVLFCPYSSCLFFTVPSFFFSFFFFSLFIYSGTHLRRSSWEQQKCFFLTELYWAVQAGLLTPLTFARHRLSPLAAFTSGAYFLHSGRWWQWICEFYTANFKGIFGSLSQNVSGNKQSLVAHAIGYPKTHFFHELAIFWSVKKGCKDTFFSTLHPLSPVIFATVSVLAFVLLRNSRFNFHHYTQCETTPTQQLSWKWPLATSCAKDYKGHSLVQTSFTEPPSTKKTRCAWGSIGTTWSKGACVEGFPLQCPNLMRLFLKGVYVFSVVHACE